MIPYPVIDPVLVSIPLPGLGELPIRWYGLAYIAGFMCGYRYFLHMAQKLPAANLSPEVIEKLFLWGVLAGVIGGRLGYTLFYNPMYYLAHPLEILQTWQGGMAIHGGMLGVILAILIFSRRYNIHPADIGDRLAPGVCFGLFFGRLANFINAELYGRPTEVSWAMIFPSDPAQLPRHPSQLYEAALEGIVLFIILHLVLRYYPRRWLVSGLFLAGYGVFRFGVEFVRSPSLPPEPLASLLPTWLSMGQFLCIPLILAGLTMVLVSFSTARHGAAR